MIDGRVWGKEGGNYSLKTSSTVHKQDCAGKSITSPKLLLIITYILDAYWWHQYSSGLFMDVEPFSSRGNTVLS